MDKMFEMIDEMMDKMCREDRMSMMKRIFEKCSEGLSADEKKGFFENMCSTESKSSAEWDMMPQMAMSMMSMMSMMLMRDMMHGGPGHSDPKGTQQGRGPMMGMGGMGGMKGGPMKMMQQMMGQQAAAEKKPASSTDNTASSGGDDSG